jgi:hypothetical protein
MEATMRRSTHLILALTVLTAAAAFGNSTSGCDLTVLIGGSERTEYFHRGTTYIEAARGADYTLRVTNPYPYRVAVALSVDGLNTIDARHTDAFNAAKWVLDPYETAEIEGWQVSHQTARRFVFTGERRSYGAALGEPDNLGVIEAVFYRERPRRALVAPFSRERQAAPPPPAAANEGAGLSDDYAATGMGDDTRHEIESVSIDLDPQPLASVRIRYEFRPQLIKLGVLDATRSPSERRERARGFEGFCPEPD